MEPVKLSNKYNWFWAPTFGFAYDLFGDGKTALRGGYGLTYETIPAGADCSYTCAANIPKVPSITLDSAPFPNPTGAATALPAPLPSATMPHSTIGRLRCRITA